MALNVACGSNRKCSLILLTLHLIGSALGILYLVAERLGVKTLKSNINDKFEDDPDYGSDIVFYWTLFYLAIQCIVLIATIISIVREKTSSIIPLLIATMVFLTLGVINVVYALYELNFDPDLRNKAVNVKVKHEFQQIREEERKNYDQEKYRLDVENEYKKEALHETIKLIVNLVFKVYSILVFYSYNVELEE